MALTAIGAVVVVTCLTWLGVRLLPASANNMRSSAVFVDGRTDVCVITGNDTLVLLSDTMHQQGVWINRHWWWPSCDGRALTLCPTTRLTASGKSHLAAPALVAQVTDSIGRLLKRKHTEEQELAYYLRSHGVQDEGYTRIATYAAQQKHVTARLDSTLKVIKAFKVNAHTRVVNVGRYQLSWYGRDNRLASKPCKPLSIDPARQGKPVIVYAQDAKKPWNAYAVRNVPWGISASKEIFIATIAPDDTVTAARTLLVNGRYTADGRHDAPRLLARNGSAVYTRHGRFIGIVKGKEVER